MQNTNYWQNDGKGFYYCPVCHKYSSEDEDGYPDIRAYTPTHCPHCSAEVLSPENQDNSSPVVEIVYCKDCKYKGFEQADGIIHCNRNGLNGLTFWKLNDFCSYGERKNE